MFSLRSGHASFPHYKETPWSFILWQGAGKVWLLLPKRAFASSEDMARCRELLAGHSKPSIWLVN